VNDVEVKPVPVNVLVTVEKVDEELHCS